ncbi:Na+/H+ antiporter NhaC family protein [Rhodobacteraceae bacterium RKSG542]|uniref:Na+/H+ antiporter NhaC family protein n=1 Tax=Pseudovibrio flavus TaxID=2529854 RepID=UPI0012BCEB0E|nr:Na+/H+ antiporter NhaC family protein [Pseudovibrio flavus]MTI18690.1 Na+/H+ antiporter NhaC family protein [Pseudovibrio flavus]
MALVSYADSAFSILPPVVAISMAIVTRKTLISLGVGILLGVFMLTDFSVGFASSEIVRRATNLFWDGSSLQVWNLNTIGFLLCMGALMALISISGGTRALAEYARSRISRGRDAKLLTIGLGVVIFIDDYFNALLVGNAARPVTDHYGVSREKLAYCIDTTSAPVCVVSPISTWGAYIMSLLAGLLVTYELTDATPLSIFVQLIPMNYYALTAFALLICVAVMRLDIGPMAAAEERAARGQLWDPEKGIPAGEEVGLPEADNGRVLSFMGPLIMLVVLVVALMLYSGTQGLNGKGEAFSVIGALENANGSWAMVTSGMITVAATIVALLAQSTPVSHIVIALGKGMKSMLPAVYILLMAWSIAAVVSDLETGKYLASLAEGNLPSGLLPVLIFMLAAAAGFSTGTSYGTFAIMLPIAANMSAALDPTLMMPAMAAVLAGGVFGDHCSPISDTTILSSTGSGCHHIDHVSTQLPYALLAAVVAGVAFIVIGFTGSQLIGFATAAAGLVVLVLGLRRAAASNASDTVAAPAE